MKIILLKDVPGTGKHYDVKEVSAGFASNYLIPNKLGVVATPSLIQKMEVEKKNALAHSKISENLALKNLGDLSGKSIIIKEKANEEGHLFAGIHGKEISEAIKRELKLDIPEDFLKIDKPIKSLGEHPISTEAFGKKVSFILVVDKS